MLVRTPDRRRVLPLPSTENQGHSDWCERNTLELSQNPLLSLLKRLMRKLRLGFDFDSVLGYKHYQDRNRLCLCEPARTDMTRVGQNVSTTDDRGRSTYFLPRQARGPKNRITGSDRSNT